MSQKIRQDLSIGKNIRDMRKAAGKTQGDVVTYLQLHGSPLSRSAYSQIECGTYNIRVSELMLLRKFFNVAYEIFFAGLPLPEEKSAADAHEAE